MKMRSVDGDNARLKTETFLKCNSVNVSMFPPLCVPNFILMLSAINARFNVAKYICLD